MNTFLSLGLPGGAEWIVLLAVVLLLFGGSRLPQLAKGLGQSIKEFKRGAGQEDFRIED
jgi:sec-independent protein translocase protein TatA